MDRIARSTAPVLGMDDAGSVLRKTLISGVSVGVAHNLIRALE